MSAATRRLRIAQVAPPLERVPPAAYGGTERIIDELARELVRRGHEVTVFASGDSEVPGRLVPTVERGLRPLGLEGDAPGWFANTLKDVLRRATEFDVIHSHLESWSLPLAAASPVPVVATFHGRLDLPWFKPLLRDAPHGLVAISRHQASAHPSVPWTVIHNGLALDGAPFREDRTDAFCFVGRVDPEKGVVDAIEIAKQTGRPLRIAAKVGNLAHQRAYHENVFLPALRAAGRDVEYLGELSRADRDALFAESYATLMPITWPEPFGLVSIESLACGTPVLARRIGALPEIVREGADGYFGEDVTAMSFHADRLGELDRRGDAGAGRRAVLGRANGRSLRRAVRPNRRSAARGVAGAAGPAGGRAERAGRGHAAIAPAEPSQLDAAARARRSKPRAPGPFALDLDASRPRYVSSDGPGFQRRERGEGFEYLDEAGRRIRDRETLARLRALAIPPAWADVWICPSRDGHIQATGRDARGRKQYRYHPAFRSRRDTDKFGRLIRFAERLPRIRRRVERDLARRGLPREKVLAAVVRLLELTRFRVGNPEYARVNRSFGLSTLRDRHARVEGHRIRFRFRGKGGRLHETELADRRLATIVRRCRELPGQELFQYVDGGEVRDVTSDDVNGYVRDAAGDDEFSAKDFRTWAATVVAHRALRDGSSGVPAAMRQTAEALGNTASVVRQSYVHPAVVEAFAGDGPGPSAPRRRRPPPGPAPDRAEELEVLDLLRRSAPGARPATRPKARRPAATGRPTTRRP